MSIHSIESNLNQKLNTSADVYTDLSHLRSLKKSALDNSQAALPEAARQFEAVMITMMMKSLRNDGMEDPLFGSQAEDSYRDMYDKQLGLEMSKGQGIGLAQAIVRQMQQQDQSLLQTDKVGKEAQQLKLPEHRVLSQHNKGSTIINQTEQVNSPVVEIFKVEPSMLNSSETLSSNFDEYLSGQFDSPKDFVEKLWPMAEKAAEKLGVTADVIVSQAALETGWGKHIITSNNSSSLNLFNIKANKSWEGDRMEKSSVEFIQGKAIQQKSDFRSYSSLQESFDDYVSFLKENPRYQSIFNKEFKAGKNININQEHFLHDTNNNYIEKLQKAGYATDPAYAEKVLNVLKSDVIQARLQSQTEISSKWR